MKVKKFKTKEKQKSTITKPFAIFFVFCSLTDRQMDKIFTVDIDDHGSDESSHKEFSRENYVSIFLQFCLL